MTGAKSLTGMLGITAYKIPDQELQMSFDQKCYELAEFFLPDNASEKQKQDLAQAIQDAIDGFLGGLEG